MTIRQTIDYVTGLYKDKKMKNGKPMAGHYKKVADTALEMYVKYSESNRWRLLDQGPGFVHSVVKVAWLHDCVEDGLVAIWALPSGLTAGELSAIRCLDKRDLPTEIYFQRIKENPLARIVKLADLAHNSKFSRLSTTEEIEKTISRQNEYLNAWMYLQDRSETL